MIHTDENSPGRRRKRNMKNIPASDHEQQFQLLSDEILHFIRKPGEMISENDLCQRFGLSRTPVRSLLQRLQENGLVTITPRRGSTVTRLNLDIINQLIYERVAVETMVLRDYVLNRNPADVERVRYLFAQLQQTAVRFGQPDFDTARFLQVDLAMHSEWFSTMRLDYLWKRLSSPHSSYTRFCMLDIMAGRNVPDVLEEHRRMLVFIEEGRTEGIEELLRRHLYGGIRRLGPMIYTEYADFFEPIDGGNHAALP